MMPTIDELLRDYARLLVAEYWAAEDRETVEDVWIRLRAVSILLGESATILTTTADRRA